MRIVSLLPSATEIVCALGLRDELVGVTHECDYPAFVRGLPKVTRTLIPHDASSSEIDALVRERLQTQRALYTLNLPVLEELKPDVIVTQALCDVCAVAEEEVQRAACSLPGRPRVINLEPMSLDEVLASIRQLGIAIGESARAERVVASLQSRIDAVAGRSANLVHRPRVVVLEWIDPPFSCGHWTPELVELAGGTEQIGQAGKPSRTTGWDEVKGCAPEVVVIACCGFDIQRTLRDVPILWQNFDKGKDCRVFVVDGSSYFSRSGPRLVDSLEILAHALHPTLHPLPDGLEAALKVAGRSPG